MPLSIYHPFINALSTLLELLETSGRQRGAAMDAVMAARLTDDMYPLDTQIGFAVYQALEVPYRMRDEAVPDQVVRHLLDGLDAAAAPAAAAGAFARARGRVADALATLHDWPADQVDGFPAGPIRIEQPNGVFAMTRERYLQDWALHQFYFHVMIAYAILRTQGIALGKSDYMPFERFRTAA